MAPSSASVGALVTTFLSWWIGELRAIYAPFNRLMSQSRPALTLSALNGQWILKIHKGGRAKELCRVDFGSDVKTGRSAVRPIIKSPKLRKGDLKILLGEQRTLRKILDMPSIAEPDLRRALSFEIERQTPFQADEVYFDYRIVNRDPETKQLTVELTTVPRATVDAILKEVRDWGLEPSSVDIAADSGKNARGIGINLIGRPETSYLGRPYLTVASAAVFALLFLAVLVIPIRQLASLDKSLAARVSDEKELADQTLAMRNNLIQTTDSSNFLDLRKQEIPQALQVLNELTKLVPDDTWLLTFQQHGKEVKISGYSAASAQLIAAIDAVPLFKSPAFSSPIVRDERQNLERFEILFEVNVDKASEP